MRSFILAAFGLLAACHAPSGDQAAEQPAANRIDAVAPRGTSSGSPEAPPAPATTAAPPATAAAPGSCTAEIGAAAAKTLANQCRQASPATHPPCNTANSCVMMRDEIARSCALFADKDPLPAALCDAGTPAPAAGTAGPAHATPAALIADYYAAIAARDYARAYRLWRDEGQASGKTLAQFRQGFADTATTKVETGPPTAPEGAAGSTYVTVPVTVTAADNAGKVQRFAGTYVLRRVNDVPGATAEMRDWRIASASLKPIR